MSTENVKQMFGKIEKDQALKDKYIALIREHHKATERTLSDKLVDLGKTSGFYFSHDDLLAARVELIDQINSNAELSEKDLASVAGGNVGSKVIFGVQSLLSFGLVCIGSGIASLVYESSEKGSCGSQLSLTEKCKI